MTQEALKLTLEALEEIALAGMSVAPEMLDEKEAFHARQAWRFIGIAARALESVKKARAEQPERHELQAKGEHPAPCARHCEANAFQIVIKNLQAQLAQPEQIPPSAYSNTHQPEQEPAMWLLTDKNINSIQVDSIQRLINRLKHAHHTDIRVRINGHDEWFEADWLKHMVRVTPPQRTWVGLTDEERNVINRHNVYVSDLIGATEAKLKEKNT